MKLLQHKDWGGTSEHGASVQKILDGTLRAMRTIGARRLSMSDICDASGVSRGTLYRYFTSKEDVLAALSEDVCSSFERGIIDAGDGIADPVERLRAVMRFYSRFTIERTPEGFFEVEPAFHLNFLRTHFERHKAAVRIAINLSLEHFEALTGTALDRDAFVDTVVRLQLSTLIVPAGPAWIDLWNRSPDRLLAWALRVANDTKGTK